MMPFELPGCQTLGTHEAWAVLSPCGSYRYALGRSWDPAPRDGEWDVVRAVFSVVMLNPSTADHQVDDPTIRKCIHFAKQEGCGSLLVRNLFAWRATSPKELRKVVDPIGKMNVEALAIDPFFAIRTAAWGQLDTWTRKRSLYTRGVVKRIRSLHVLALTERGYDQTSHFSDRLTRQPRHPLYLPNATRAVLWTEASKG